MVRMGYDEDMKHIWEFVKRFGLAVGLIGLVLVVMTFNKRIADYHRLREQRDQWAITATHVEATYEALQTHLAEVTSPAYVREWAMNHGYMETQSVPVGIVPDAAATPQPSPTPITTVEPMSNLEIWLSLLFGGEN
jgi:hypothetical protein